MAGQRDIDKILKRLNRLPREIARTEVFFKEVATFLDKWKAANFKREGTLAMDGRRWKALKASTVRQRRTGKKKGRAPRILQDTGKGRASVRIKSSRRNAMIFSDLGYMAHHHTGTRTLPARRIIPEARQVEKKVATMGESYLRRAVKKSGL